MFNDYHWFDADNFWFSKNELDLKEQILLNGNVELELCDKNSKSCGCNYPECVSVETKTWADEIHPILRAKLVKFLPPDMINRSTTFSLKSWREVIAITHGDEKNSFWMGIVRYKEL